MAPTMFAIHLPQQTALRLRQQAFGDHLQAQAVRPDDDRLAQRQVAGAYTQVVREGLVVTKDRTNPVAAANFGSALLLAGYFPMSLNISRLFSRRMRAGSPRLEYDIFNADNVGWHLSGSAYAGGRNSFGPCRR